MYLYLDLTKMFQGPLNFHIQWVYEKVQERSFPLNISKPGWSELGVTWSCPEPFIIFLGIGLKIFSPVSKNKVSVR